MFQNELLNFDECDGIRVASYLRFKLDGKFPTFNDSPIIIQIEIGISDKSLDVKKRWFSIGARCPAPRFTDGWKK